MLVAPFLPTEEIKVPVEGGELSIFRYGELRAGTPLLLIHGVTSSNRAWQYFAQAAIARGYVPYAVDLRGRGHSNHLPPPFGMRYHAKDMAAVVDYLGLESIQVIGHSSGAFVAVALKGLYPEKVARMFLMDGGIPLNLPPGLDLDQILAAVLGPALTRLSMEFASKEEYRNYWKPQPAFSRGWNPVLDEYVDYDLQGIEPHLRPSTNPDCIRPDAEDQWGNDLMFNSLQGLQEEVLFIRAERGLQNDPLGLYPMAILDAVLPTFPKLKLVQVEDANHYELLLDPDIAEKCAAIIFDS